MIPEIHFSSGFDGLKLLLKEIGYGYTATSTDGRGTECATSRSRSGFEKSTLGDHLPFTGSANFSPTSHFPATVSTDTSM